MTSQLPDRGGLPPEETLRRWVEGLASDDEERARAAYTSLYRSCRPLLLAVARPLVADTAKAEDTVEALLAWFWESRRTLGISGSVRSYLLVSIHHRCHKARRWSKRMGELPDEPAQRGTVVGVGRPSGLFGPEADLYEHELNDRLKRAFVELSDDRRQALELMRRGLTHAEIGKYMGRSPGAAAKLIFRARKDLHAFMGWLREEAGGV